jgi:predicted lipoprotein with Yx(FWY)xxD motif
MLKKLMVMVLALVLSALPAGAQDLLPDTVNLGGNDALGTFLVGPNGLTLYTFRRDALDVSNCTGNCLNAWPPLVVESADALSKPEGVPGELGTIEREDGSLQVTYNGQPLYYWVNDAVSGDATGHNFRQVWFVARPATVYVGGNAELGAFLVGETGMTLYRFANDEPGVSNCIDQCAANWPPVTVESADALVIGNNLPGKFGTIERADGTLQVTYNDSPLYTWVNDAVRGDATGQNVRDVWFVVPPETVAVSSSAEKGDYLVAANGYTLYLFANDEVGVSNCIDQCAENWPPLLALPGENLVAGVGVPGELGTIERADGALQVTYNGMPLYLWVQDTAPGDTTGDGVGGVWSLVMP